MCVYNINKHPTTTSSPLFLYQTMLPTKFRFADRGLFDRVQYLLNNYTINDDNINQRLKTVLSLMNISADKNKNKFVNLLQKIEKHLLKKSNYNIVIRNIPHVGISASSGYTVPVNYVSLRDTMNQFGSVKSLYIKNGVSYIEMTDNVYTHNTLNQMQIGHNIISTEVV
jgi:hypothetical protein